MSLQDILARRKRAQEEAEDGDDRYYDPSKDSRQPPASKNPVPSFKGFPVPKDDFQITQISLADGHDSSSGNESEDSDGRGEGGQLAIQQQIAAYQQDLRRQSLQQHVASGGHRSLATVASEGDSDELPAPVQVADSLGPSKPRHPAYNLPRLPPRLEPALVPLRGSGATEPPAPHRDASSVASGSSGSDGSLSDDGGDVLDQIAAYQRRLKDQSLGQLLGGSVGCTDSHPGESRPPGTEGGARGRGATPRNVGGHHLEAAMVDDVLASFHTVSKPLPASPQKDQMVSGEEWGPRDGLPRRRVGLHSTAGYCGGLDELPTAHDADEAGLGEKMLAIGLTPKPVRLMFSQDAPSVPEAEDLLVNLAGRAGIEGGDKLEGGDAEEPVSSFCVCCPQWAQHCRLPRWLQRCKTRAKHALLNLPPWAQVRLILPSPPRVPLAFPPSPPHPAFIPRCSRFGDPGIGQGLMGW